MSNFRDPRAEAWGRAAERAVREAYTRLGWFVVPAHLIEDGGAPMLTGLLKKFVLPDFLAAKNGKSWWLEVKFKTACVEYRITGFWRHGIDIPKWDDYRKVEELTGIPGWIAVLQYRPSPKAAPCPHLLIQSFEALARVVDFDRRPTASAPRGMVYWNVDEMDVVGPLDFDFTNIPEMTRKVHAWEEKSKAGLAPQVDLKTQQRSLFSWVPPKDET